MWTSWVRVLSYRLHELGLLSDWQYRGLCIEVAKRGRSVEPEEAAREVSQILPKIMSLLYDEGLTRSRVAQELCLPTPELEQLLFGFAITGLEGGKAYHSGRSRAKLERLK